MNFDVIPAIDLRGGQVVRLRQADYTQQTTYTTHPCALARRYAKATETGPPGSYRVTFTGIDGSSDYIRLSGYLQGMSVVRGITPVRATPEGLELELELLTGLPGFRRLADVFPVLRKVEAALARVDRAAHARWGFYQVIEARKPA